MKVLVVVLCVLAVLLAFIFYCCCCAASRADRWMEELDRLRELDKDNERISPDR